MLIRGYEAGDETRILELFAQAFHQPRGLPHWRWKYRDSPYGALRISLAVDGEGRAVAHYAGYPVPFCRTSADGHATMMGYQIGDTMTRPEARGIGRRSTSLLARTAEDFYARFCAGRVAFNYGFNVGGIQRFSMRALRADRVESVPFRIRELTPAWRAPGRWRRVVGGWTAAAVEAVDDSWDDFFARVAPAYRFLVRRDARYVRWRYLERPDVPYLVLAARRRRALVGWGVFARRDEALIWGDALVDPDHADAAGLLLAVAATHPIARGARHVQGWFSSRPAWFASVLDGLGFRTEAEPQDLGLMCVPWQAVEATAWMRQDLYYTWGDSDLF